MLIDWRSSRLNDAAAPVLVGSALRLPQLLPPIVFVHVTSDLEKADSQACQLLHEHRCRELPTWRARHARVNLAHHGVTSTPFIFGSGARCEVADEMLLDFFSGMPMLVMLVRFSRRFAISEVADHTQEVEL